MWRAAVRWPSPVGLRSLQGGHLSPSKALYAFLGTFSITTIFILSMCWAWCDCRLPGGISLVVALLQPVAQLALVQPAAVCMEGWVGCWGHWEPCGSSTWLEWAWPCAGGGSIMEGVFLCLCRRRRVEETNCDLNYSSRAALVVHPPPTLTCWLHIALNARLHTGRGWAGEKLHALSKRCNFG